MSGLLAIDAMEFCRWLLIGILTILIYKLSSIHNFPSPDPNGNPSKKHLERPVTNACYTARPAVVTLYAGLEFGSGSIISTSGLVLTNNHVIREAGSPQIRVRTWGGNLFTGWVVATDSTNDLALVQLNTGSKLSTVYLTKSEAIHAGQEVCAIGSPFARTGVITLGKLKRILKNGDIESSILLHPGNSGGPLFNTQGAMIGINKSGLLSETGENLGVGFSIPTAVARNFVEQNCSKPGLPTGSCTLLQKGMFPENHTDSDSNTSSVTPSSYDSEHPSTGSYFGAIVSDQSLVIQIVEPNSPAEKAGLTGGDRLLAVDNQQLKRFADLQALLERRPRSAVFTISREQQQQKVRVEF